MAATVGDLAVRIGADTAGLESGLTSASGRVRTFSTTAVNNLRNVASGALKVTAGVSVLTAGMLKLTSTTAATAKEIKLLSTLANASTSEFQRMAYGAAQVSVDADKLSDILKDMNDRVGDFIQTGGGPMADFFENIAPKIGVTADQFKNLSGPEALQLYVSTLEKANLTQADMVFYMETIASDSTALLPLLKNNGAGFAEMAAKADLFNKVISEQDISDLVDVDTQFKRIGSNITTAKDIMATGFLPEVKTLQEYAVNISQKFVDIVASLRDAKREAEKQAEVEEKISKVIGAKTRGAQKFRSEESKAAEEVNNLMLRQVEIQKILDTGFVRATGQASRSNSKRREAFEETKVALAAEMEANEIIIAQLVEQSNKAAEIKKIREESAVLKKEEAETPVSTTPEVPESDNGLDKSTLDKIANIKSQYETEEELNRIHREEMALIGEEYDARKFESEEQWRSIAEQAEQAHLDRMKEFNIKHMTDLEKFNAQTWQNKAKAVSSSLADMTAGVAQSSKTMFKINKVAGIASAAINTAQGVTKALAEYPPPISFAMAAAQAAAGMAQISAIKSTSFGGGSTVTAPSQAGTVAAQQTSTSSASAGANAGQTLTVAPIDPSAIFGGANVSAMAESLYNFSKDGGKVVFSA